MPTTLQIKNEITSLMIRIYKLERQLAAAYVTDYEYKTSAWADHQRTIQRLDEERK